MWGAHSLNSTHLSEGSFNLIFESLRRNPVKFFNYFRMSALSFDELLTVHLLTRLTETDTNFRKCINLAEKLTVTLR